MSDRAPILASSDPSPPKYAEMFQTTTTFPTGAACDTVDTPPPPYTPNTLYSYDHIIPLSAGQSYQNIDFAAGDQVGVIALCHLGPEPCQAQCPNCGQVVQTVTYPRAGTLTFLSATLCFLFCIICTFLPFCMEELQDVEHRCPNCSYHFGTFRRI